MRYPGEKYTANQLDQNDGVSRAEHSYLCTRRRGEDGGCVIGQGGWVNVSLLAEAIFALKV